MKKRAYAHVTGRSIVVTTRDGERFLVAELEIDCEICGEHHIRLAGHHVRAIHQLLEEFMQLHPDLVGKDDEIRTDGRTQHEAVLALVDDDDDFDPTLN